MKVKYGLNAYLPHKVVALIVDNDWSVIRAWREYLGLTQQEMAQRLDISQSAYSQQESNKHLRKTSRDKIAAALGIRSDQLDV